MTREEELVKNVQFVESALCAACKKAGRNPQDVTLMAVTKYAQDKDVLTLLAKGLIRHIGESRVQQAEKRWTSPVFAQYKTVKHFIGHLQKNKAAKAARLFDFIDSLDNEETALALNRTAPAGKLLRALVQIKLTQKDTQSGLPLNEARALVKKLMGLEHIKICGYMGIAPQGATAEELHRIFKQVKTAFDQDFPSGERYLSLGMSEDFRAAVEEGSTLPRIGSRLFATTLEGL